ncbi:DNA/RNA endonuclease G (NUC1) [Pseudoxanthomonas japonensis]|uniref:DNA/RNA non-specific endonuclease n=1 Tax=Pseudoxanthomonas japonensis TaxID=69284 RepID=UPI002858C84E|nr:DNA/RNA non-specific endonuclease [Pseudoxanthomonas japonensis]MDR7069780.1 DNA/RNA endonuclease G (NUC1) [Pseudoxanthomonas japonensis]
MSPRSLVRVWPRAALLLLLGAAVAGCTTRGAVRSASGDRSEVRQVQVRVPHDAHTRPHFNDADTDTAMAGDAAEMAGDAPEMAMAAGDAPLPPPPANARAALAAPASVAITQCPFGEPVPRRGVEFGPTERVVRAGYALLHSADLKTPYWVCETYTTSSLRNNVERGSRLFKADPQLRLARAVPGDYSRSSQHRTRAGLFPIDIGHMAPAEAHSSSESRIADTFYLSNTVPQHRSMNRGQWARLEACARTTGPVRGAKWVISGPMIYDERDVAFVTVDTIGDGVVIPTHTWKILVYRTPDDVLQAWAAVMPNAVLPENSQLDDFAVSIDAIEDATGFDFLPRLSAAEQRRLEGTVRPIQCQ